MIWTLLTQNPIARAVAKIAAVALAVLTFGAWQRRQGRKLAEANASLEALQAERKTHERINNADTGAGLDDDQRIDRLRDFAARHGKRDGSSEAGGR